MALAGFDFGVAPQISVSGEKRYRNFRPIVGCDFRCLPTNFGVQSEEYRNPKPYKYVGISVFRDFWLQNFKRGNRN